MKIKWILITVLSASTVLSQPLKIDPLLEKIAQLHVNEQPLEQLKENALQTILLGLDPYSTYISPKEAKKLKESLSGDFYGIGLSLQLSSHGLKITSVLPNSPADQAGVNAGNYIIKINGQPIHTTSLSSNTKQFDNHNTVSITLETGESITLQKALIHRSSIQYNTIDGIGYIQIYLFDEKTEEQLKTIFSTEHTAYLIDLRHNPGGLLKSAVACAALFLNPDQNTITHISTKESTYPIVTKTSSINKQPLYILIGPESASGAELFSSVLQYYKQATILGQTSKGKGSIQSLIPINNNGYLKLTTAYFSTPSGNPIDKIGIHPDYKTTNNPKQSLEFIMSHLNTGDTQ